jgi:LacI family transcriptional regulator
MPVVLCNYSLEGVPSILVDHISSIYQTTSYLLDLGHRRIALLNLAAPHYHPARMRRKGFGQAFADRALAPDPMLIVELDLPTYAHDDWIDVINQLLDRDDPPTAVVAFNDQVALQVYAICKQRGCRIPDDLSVTGCDDILSARHVDPPLTTVRIPARELGQRAMIYLLQRICGEDIPPVTRLATELIVRDSCAPLRKTL